LARDVDERARTMITRPGDLWHAEPGQWCFCCGKVIDEGSVMIAYQGYLEEPLMGKMIFMHPDCTARVVERLV
jgi:hypothetical protein